MRTSPAPGAGTSTLSYTRASGPPTLCTRTALVMTISPSVSIQAPALKLKRKPSTPHCQLARPKRLVGGLFAIAPGQHVEQFDRRRERDGEIDVAEWKV